MKDKIVELKPKKKSDTTEPPDQKDPIKFLSMMAGLIENDPDKRNTYDLTLIMVKKDVAKQQASLHVMSTLEQLAEVNIDIDRAKNYVLNNGRVN